MSWVFGKSIETRHGSFSPGQSIPPEWDTRETRRQLVEKFGKDVLVQGGSASNEALATRLAAVERSLEEIKEALGIEPKEAQKSGSQAKGRA